MEKRGFLFFLSAIYCILNTIAQNTHEGTRKIDSLFVVLKASKEDTNKLKTLNILARKLYYINPDTSAMLGAKALTLCHALSSTTNPSILLCVKKQKVTAYNFMGWSFKDKGNFTLSLDYYKKSLALSSELKDLANTATTLSQTGVVYTEMGNYPQALISNLSALHTYENLGNKYAMSTSLSNIGNIYYLQKDYANALNNYSKALEYCEALNDPASISHCYGNIGEVYSKFGDYRKSLEYLLKAERLNEASQNKYGMSTQLGNIATVYENLGDTSKAIDYYFRSLKINEELGIKIQIATTLSNLGSLFRIQKKYKEAEKYLLKAFAIETAAQSIIGLKFGHQELSELYSATGRHKLALHHYKQFIAASDSLNNEETTKKITRTQMQYEFGKKETATKLEQEKKEVIAAAEGKKQKVIILSVTGMLLLVLAFAVFALRSYLQKQKANIEISKQKDIIEEKQKEIIDSIYYARRIQRALLPQEKYIDKNLNRPIKNN